MQKGHSGFLFVHDLKPSCAQVRNLKRLFDVRDVVDDVQGVVDDTVQRTTDNLHHVRIPNTNWPESSSCRSGCKWFVARCLYLPTLVDACQ